MRLTLMAGSSGMLGDETQERRETRSDAEGRKRSCQKADDSVACHANAFPQALIAPTCLRLEATPCGMVSFDASAEPVSRAQDVSHPPFMLLVNLNEAREKIDSSGIAVVVGNLRAVPHLLDDHEQV